jgi:uracil-DNA glycosylase family protein
MLIGEQPGEQEDLTGRPFVGPAGKVLDRALEAAGLDRNELYITNAVKHFKNERRGKRRLHKKPDTGEIDACRWWLDNELDLVQPAVAVALGATAARGLMRKALTINANRGQLIPLRGFRALITVHPSSAETPGGARQAARVRPTGQGFARRRRRGAAEGRP